MIFRIVLQHICIIIILTSCASVSQRVEYADKLANEAGFEKVIVATSPFRLLAYQRISRPGATIVIYIEGDGLAFTQANSVSLNPTPVNPIALKLALMDDSENVIYLARPCQYFTSGEDTACHSEYWTSRRYAPEVIESINTAIGYFKTRSNLVGIRLVGYSGGGTVAAIVAAGRTDVIDLRTIAGNLDINAFTSYHNVTPLSGSINPVDFATELSTVPQVHYYGAEDDVIPDVIRESYTTAISKFDPQNSCITLQRVAGVSHFEGWEGVWQRYLHRKGECRKH